jgi:hypothetical protein
MKFYQFNSLRYLCLFFFSTAFVYGCDCWGGSTTGGTKVATCDTLKFSVTGRVGSYGLSGNLKGTAIDNNTSLSWQFDEGSGTVLDGASGTGGVDSVNATGKARVIKDTIMGQGGIQIEITGTITGPPKPCSGSGSWRIISGGTIGSGRWQFN